MKNYEFELALGTFNSPRRIDSFKKIGTNESILQESIKKIVKNYNFIQFFKISNNFKKIFLNGFSKIIYFS